MRCPSCEKFVSYDDPECEEQDSAAVDGTTVTANVRVILKCADCGDELKETTFDLEGEAVPKAKCKVGEDEDAVEHEWDVVDASYDSTDRYESVDKKGRAIPSRFQKHYYGVCATVKLHCTREGCSEECEVELTDETQASGFDELV